MPTVGQKASAAAMDLITAICCVDPALNPEVRPVYAHRERLQAEFGERRADQMVNETRNLCLYPNVYPDGSVLDANPRNPPHCGG